MGIKIRYPELIQRNYMGYEVGLWLNAQNLYELRPSS